MMPTGRNSTDAAKLIRWRFAVSGMVIAGVAGVSVSLLQKNSPGNAPAVPAVVTYDAAALAKLYSEASAQEGLWREAEKVPEQASAAKTHLEKTVSALQLWNRHAPRPSAAEGERLRVLERTLDDLRAGESQQLIRDYEQAAMDLYTQGENAAGVAKLRAAFALQEAINRSSASDSVKDFTKESRLFFDAETWEAEPLATQELALDTKAQLAEKSAAWTEALSAYKAAGELQQRLNREYPRTRFASHAKALDYETKIATLLAAAPAAEVEKSIQQAESLSKEGKHSEAAVVFSKARSQQLSIDQTYAGTRFAAAGRADELEVRAQTESAFAACERLQREDGQITQLLKSGAVKDAVTLITESERLATQVFKDYPRSTRLDVKARQRLSYRWEKRGELASIQTQLAAAVRGIGAGREVLRAPVTQGLYALIIGRNPSRTEGAQLPVDSVNWTEAAEFAERLSWVLGRSVRLPMETELASANEGESARAEWVFANADEADAPLIGGGSRRVSPKSERSRAVSFRVVLE